MFEIGTATDHQDLLTKLDTFLTATGSAFGLTYAGTGTGTFTAYKGGASSVAETFTITATSATNWTVVGSVSGSIGPATTGTPFSHAKIAFTITAGGTAFIAGDVFTIATAPKWTQKLGAPTATSTRWRVNVLSSVGGSSPWLPKLARVEMMTTVGGADQVTGGTASSSSDNGSNTAAKAADTDNTTYWQPTTAAGWWEYLFASTKAIKEIAITFPQGETFGEYGTLDFQLQYWSGTAYVTVAAWRNETSWASSERRVFRASNFIWQAPGNDGAGQIFVGVAAFQNAAAGWYNWRLNGFTAYDATSDWFQQPGVINNADPYGPIVPLSNGSLSYWFVCNGRRVMGIAKSASSYQAFYLGLIQPYASPGQWPYPLFVGGSLWFQDEPLFASSLWSVGNAHSTHSGFVLPFAPNLTLSLPYGGGRLRKADGTWRGFMSRSDFYDPKDDPLIPRTWPYAYGFTNLKADLDGQYPLYPVIYLEEAPDNIFGQLDGISAVPGTGLSAEAQILNGREDWRAFPDITRSTAGDFFAMRMD